MSCLKRQFKQSENSQKNIDQNSDNKSAVEESMSPGLTGEYDWELREKAGMRQPPVSPEHMGLDAEYDANGLAKRVAAAFDKHPDIQDVQTLEIFQDGCKIILKGSLPNQSILEQMIHVASKVDGTKAVDTSQVEIKAN
ncbi:hypothetical protein [Calothrix sp. PCC 6303]|uniref:hypothetical protein n=1 Tax=Calothrix sp. PCC 6303 TaxID=1170562 RepID=UPI0002A00B85|nr:hypothetical protein [Calothrix sp. PCC 6303]AFY99602.1 hypothetical protein Cal6303_0528 [Calothrix sp. PCC 6303]